MAEPHPTGEDAPTRLEALARQLPAIVWTTDLELRVTSAVGGGLAALGLSRDDVLGLTLYEYLGSDVRNRAPIEAHKRALEGESVKYEVDWVGRHFETYSEPFRNERGEIIGTLGIALDVTERKQADEERTRLHARLRDQQKLEAIGQLAAGVAHEINNPIQSIMNFAQLIRARSNEATSSEYAEEIQLEAQRVASIVRNLQVFVQQADEMAIEVGLADLVERTLSLYSSALRKEFISVTVELPDDLPVVWFRPQGLQQIIVNLLTNAREALNFRFPAEHADKRVRISARATASGVRLSFEDAGEPIAAAEQERVFEPFVSLPGRDSGSGLGLSIAHGAARESGAVLSCEAAADRTTFHLDLPLPGD